MSLFEPSCRCNVCKKRINILKDTDFTIQVKNSNKGEIDNYYHCNCYIDKYTNLKRGKRSLEKCQDELDTMKIYTEKKKLDIIEMNNFLGWLSNTYNVVFFPDYFYTKLSNIISGDYKGLSCGVPISDLYDMWKKKIDYLTKVADYNKKKGNEIDNLGRINYDLAVLLSKYDSYLDWKEKNRLLMKEQAIISMEKENAKVNFNRIGNIRSKIDSKENGKLKDNDTLLNILDINSIIDEI